MKNAEVKDAWREAKILAEAYEAGELVLNPYQQLMFTEIFRDREDQLKDKDSLEEALFIIVHCTDEEQLDEEIMYWRDLEEVQEWRMNPTVNEIAEAKLKNTQEDYELSDLYNYA